MKTPEAVTALDRLEERATGMCKPEEFMRTPAGVVIDARLDIDSKLAEYARSFEHEIFIRCFVRFWANKAQFQDGRKRAESRLAAMLYGDVIEELEGIMHAISDGDRLAALNRCAALKGRLCR